MMKCIFFFIMNIYFWSDFFTNGFKTEFVDILYILSVFFGIFTIITKNPIVSVLYLIGLFVSISGILVLIGLNFLGLSYILVYVGAVSILFLFILMLINIRISELLNETNNDIPLAILTVLLFYNIIGQVLPANLTDNTIVSNLSKTLSDICNIQLNIANPEYIENLEQQIFYAYSKTWDSSLVDVTHISGIGNIMYTNYAIWLIIVSIILLVGMVGAIVITIKQK